MQNLLNAIKDGLNAEVAIKEINNIKTQKDNKQKEIIEFKQNMNNVPQITREDVKKYFYDIRNIFYNSDLTEKKRTTKNFRL